MKNIKIITATIDKVIVKRMPPILKIIPTIIKKITSKGLSDVVEELPANRLIQNK
jgi:hypothetical protein